MLTPWKITIKVVRPRCAAGATLILIFHGKIGAYREEGEA
jgi:hypothetical protein